MRPISHMGWVGRRLALSLALFSLASDAGAAVLFPQPLHLTRRIEDPLTQRPLIVDEFYVGNRVITAVSDRVTVADHEKQELLEINRATYSITSFAEIARARKATGTSRRPIAQTQAIRRSDMKPLGVRQSATGRPITAFAVTADTADERAELIVGVDRTITMSREALDVILGAAYPSVPAAHHDALVRATAVGDAFGLPLEQTLSIQTDGGTVTIKSTIIYVGRELPPPEMTIIPRGAQRIDSALITASRILEQLEPLPASQRR